MKTNQRIRRHHGKFLRIRPQTMNLLFPEKAFWSRMLRFSIPIALQNLSVALLAIVDVSLISSMGENAVAAVSLANQVTYVTSLIAFGITSGASVYLSRAFGAKNKAEVKKNFAVMMFYSILLNLIVALVSLITPKGMLALYTNKQELMDLGAVYLLIVTPTFVLYGISNGMSTFFRSANLPAKPMITSLVTIFVKTGLNCVMIYGLGPIPSMGIAGAAIATLVSRIVELLMYIFFLAQFKEKDYIFSMRDVLLIKWNNLKIFMRDTYPVILNETLWGLGLSSFSAIFGRMGAMELSALSVAQQLENLCNSFFYGIGIGACVSISYVIGEKRYEDARRLARQYAVSGFYVGLCIMMLMLGINHMYVNVCFSDLTLETRQIAQWLIVIYAVYMPFRSLASSMIMGALRAGGDSKSAMLYDVLPIYVWSLPLGFLTGIVLHWGMVPVLFIMQFKRVIKSGLALRRLLSDRWICKSCT